MANAGDLFNTTGSGVDETKGADPANNAGAGVDEKPKPASDTIAPEIGAAVDDPVKAAGVEEANAPLYNGAEVEEANAPSYNGAELGEENAPANNDPGAESPMADTG